MHFLHDHVLDLLLRFSDPASNLFNYLVVQITLVVHKALLVLFAFVIFFDNGPLILMLYLLPHSSFHNVHIIFDRP